ncbi:MAG TPA: ATP-binding protein [Rhodanobacteraceae bacterium]|nr:ATP-binding protein [Rhodanobacteraceae bacterium]
MRRAMGALMERMFKRSVDELQSIVAETERFFSENAIDPSIRVAVDLSIEELFVNMVQYNLGTDHDILMRLSQVDGGVEVCLTDYDVEPFDPSRAPSYDVDAPLAEREPRGMGLYLVSKMVDSMHYEYRNRESRVTFFKGAGAEP